MTVSTPEFSRDVLTIDAAGEIERIIAALRREVLGNLRKKGCVLGLSGGVDSSVVAALSVRALGKERVLGLLMPDRDSSPDSLRLGLAVAERFGIETVTHDIAPALDALGCYRWQREAIRQVFPDYDEGWKHKLSLPSVLEEDRFSISILTVESPAGERRSARMSAAAYRQLVAATNFKQRTRKAYEYYHADRLNYAVAGTPNRLEYDQGFFVKGGDGLADIKPIAHLYKTQVYALATALDVPREIRERPPTTDTYSLPQGQDEFYFSLPHADMDVALYGRDHGVPAAAVASVLALTPEQIQRVYRDIDAKRRVARYLHAAPVLVTA